MNSLPTRYVRDDLVPHHRQSKSTTKGLGWQWQLFLTVVGSVFALSGLWMSGIFEAPELTSPITSSSTFQFLPFNDSHSANSIVYGFLPYWNLDSATIQPEVTHLGYFGLTIGSDGSLLTQTSEGGEPGFAKLKSDEFLELVKVAEQNDIALEIVTAQFNNDDIVAFLSSEKAQQEYLSSLDSVLLAYPFSGVNLDIEYSGPITKTIRTNMTRFVKTVDEHLETKYEDVQLSIDVYASAAAGEHLWDVAAIGEHVDLMIIMAYDFHRRSSPKAGPVAPLFGGKSLWDHDINEHLIKFIASVPAEKLLLGVPFYGYEWQTTSIDPQAFTMPNTGATASYKRVQELLAQKEELEVEERWSEDALSPFITYREDGDSYVVYFENSRSISYKLDFVNQLELGGMAIWALGYEGDSRDLWDVVERKL